MLLDCEVIILHIFAHKQLQLALEVYFFIRYVYHYVILIECVPWELVLNSLQICKVLILLTSLTVYRGDLLC